MFALYDESRAGSRQSWSMCFRLSQSQPILVIDSNLFCIANPSSRQRSFTGKQMASYMFTYKGPLLHISHISHQMTISAPLIVDERVISFVVL